MKNLLLILIFCFAGILFAQNSWINELHYDNDGADVGEFVEVVIQDPGSWELSLFAVTLYNGAGGASYGTHTLGSFTVGTSSGGYTIYTKPIAGIQNGAPDGLALDYDGTLIQFLSYEGTFTAVGGPADGVESVDIGVFEPGVTPVGYSLQLAGSGTQYSDFTWQIPAEDTPGDLNNTQVFGTGPGPVVISNFLTEYLVPPANTSCWGRCDVSGGVPPYTVLMKYTIDGVPQTDIVMSNIGGNTWEGTIDGQVDETRVTVYVEATDSAVRRETAQSPVMAGFWGTSDISIGTDKIKEIDADGALVYTGYFCRVTGVATIGSGIFSTANLDIYLQDANGGVNIFYSGGGAYPIIQGNEYSIVGQLTQFNGKTEVVPAGVTYITDNGPATMPSPMIISIADFLADPETYEGSLIGIQHCVNNTTRVWPGSGSFVNVEMTDDGGTSLLELRINNVTAPVPEPMWPADIVGIANQYDTSSPYDSGYQWMSRNPDDFFPDGELPVILSSFTASLIQNEYVAISWVTQSESNMNHFNLWRNNLILQSFPAGNTSMETTYEYLDEEIELGETYQYQLEAVQIDGESSIIAEASITVEIDEPETPEVPQTSRLHANYPNPFNPETRIRFQIKDGDSGKFSIFNARGQLLEQHKYSTGFHEYIWDAAKYGSGVYLYKLETNTYSEIKKMVMSK